MPPMQKSSFTRRAKGQSESIAGVTSVPSRNLLAISTGVPSIDRLVGGIAIGSLVLVAEDSQKIISCRFLKCCLAEGIHNGHENLIFAHESALLRDLPMSVEKTARSQCETMDDGLRIAWRYADQRQSGNFAQDGGHSQRQYDFSKRMSAEDISKATNVVEPEDYRSVREIVSQKILEKFSSSKSNRPSNVLRIFIDGFGSPLSKGDLTEMYQFLFTLKSLLRSSYAVAFISVPVQLFDEVAVEKFKKFSDIALSFTSFSNLSEKPNIAYKDYQGLMRVDKVVTLNALGMSSKLLPLLSCDWAVKSTKKSLAVEPLHLPPAIGEIAKDVGCSSHKSSHLDEF